MHILSVYSINFYYSLKSVSVLAHLQCKDLKLHLVATILYLGQWARLSLVQSTLHLLVHAVAYTIEDHPIMSAKQWHTESIENKHAIVLK